MDFFPIIAKLITGIKTIHRAWDFLKCGHRVYAVACVSAWLFVVLAATPSLDAEWHAAGFAGTLSRLQADRINFSTFRSGPESTITPVIGVVGGRSIWRVMVDGTFMRSTTGQTDVIVGPTARLTRASKGYGLFVDGGAEWPLWRVGGFRILVRGGYGTARVHVPTAVPIDDHRQFWTYGFVGMRTIGTRYVVRIDVRNAHFRREEIPETLGRYNVIASGGFGLRF